MGNPNARKSVIFSRLAGIAVIYANYPGTIVEHTERRMNWLSRDSCGLMGAVSTTGGSHRQGKGATVDAPRKLSKDPRCACNDEIWEKTQEVLRIHLF
jgi:hypothetical protein